MTVRTKTVQYQNPIVSGFSPDPSVVFVDGTFYLATSSFHVFPGLPIYASQNLREWTHIGNAINRPDQLSLEWATMAKMPLDTGHYMIGAGGLFAPTIRYNKGKFYIICTNCVLKGDEFRLQNFVISTSDIWGGPWSDPVDISFQGIDPSLFFDDDDRVYFQGCFMLGRDKQPSCTIKQFEIDLETGKPLSEEREIWGGHAKYDTEGPHIYKIGKWYYLLVAEGGTFEHHMLCISRSENIWGPYEDFGGNPILTADGTSAYIQNTGHGELFQDGSGQWWAVALGVRNVNQKEAAANDKFIAPLGRESFLAPVEWSEGEWPKILQPTMEFTAPSVAYSNPMTLGDKKETQFASAPPNVENLYIRIPDASKYQLPDGENGVITLRPSQSTLSTPTGTSTFLGRRQRSLESIATASLRLTSVQKNTQAGIALYKDHLRHVSLVYDQHTAALSFCVASLERNETIPGNFAINSSSKQLHLKIKSYPTHWVFFANQTDDGAIDDAAWVEIGSIQAWEQSAREMTGPILGIFAHSVSTLDVEGGVEFVHFDVRNE